MEYYNEDEAHLSLNEKNDVEASGISTEAALGSEQKLFIYRICVGARSLVWIIFHLRGVLLTRIIISL